MIELDDDNVDDDDEDYDDAADDDDDDEKNESCWLPPSHWFHALCVAPVNTAICHKYSWTHEYYDISSPKNQLF